MTLQDIKKDLIAHGGSLPGVYKITRKSDSRVYIGQTEKPIIDRIEQHIKNVRINKNSDSIDRAIQLEGIDAFKYEVEVFLPHADTDQLWDLESQYIAKYDSYEHGFNLTKGNHIGKSIKNTASYIMHVVKVNVFKNNVAWPFNLDFRNKKILLVNYFGPRVLNYLEYENCEVTAIHSSDFVETNSNGELKVNSKKYGEYIMEELNKHIDEHFDIVISNPPYSAIGADITDKIRKEINYDEFINLLPANDYQRNETKDLFRYAELSTMKPIINGFDDATVTTHIARINKEPCMYISADEFEIENYTDKSLKKYFYENLKRKHAAIDSAELSGATDKQFKKFDIERTVLFGNRDVNHKHLPYDKQCDTYKYNVEKSVTNDYIFENRKATRGGVYDGWLHVAGITFDTPEEKLNFVEFIYSKLGFRFLSKIFTAVNIDGTINCGKVFPKVDWKKKWTVESILANYGYTTAEIAEIITDLNNYRGLDD